MRTYRRGQEGSALLIALLAMIFLTVIGLTLAMVAETEMLIGTNEQIAGENFVAAEAGIATAVSQLLVNNDLESRFFALQSKNLDGSIRDMSGSNRTLGYSVDFTDVYPTARQCAPYSDCGEQAPGDHKYSYFFFTRVRSRRLAWPASQAVPDCGSEAKRNPDTPTTLQYFREIQAENVVTLGFYASPLPELGGDALWDSFVKPDVYGCSPEKKDVDYIQNAAALPPPP